MGATLRVWPLVKEYFILLFCAKVLISVVWSRATLAFCSHGCPQWLCFDDRNLFVWLCEQRWWQQNVLHGQPTLLWDCESSVVWKLSGTSSFFIGICSFFNGNLWQWCGEKIIISVVSKSHFKLSWEHWEQVPVTSGAGLLACWAQKTTPTNLLYNTGRDSGST